jgi:Tol biopolymer transport system component
MGVVYRATDSKLKREVAIKVLPEALAADAERLARFEREAQLLAQLQHPSIASIYGLEESGGVRALVMELAPGEDLAERLKRGPLPLDEALAVARQIAEALEAAHEKGIVHRDLKPANVKLTPDGNVKVLDFGLAKAMDPPPGSASAADLARSPTLMNSPTMTAAQGTQLGVILGTAAYMSPEQARGGAVDKRADIWAFGVVLHEMLSGRSLFAADTVSDTLAGVLKSEVDLSKLPESIPAPIRRLLRRCLERNPKNRLHDIADARIVLDEVLSGRVEESGAAGVPHALPRRSRLGRFLPWAVAALAATVAVAVAAVHRRDAPVSPGPIIRFQVELPDAAGSTRRGIGFELSPDGRHLVVATGGELWLRPLDAVSFRRLEGIEDATYPFWSPDGAWIGFFASGRLQKVARDGGRPQTICDAPAGRGAAWAPDGDIVFSTRYGSGGLWRVSAQGGQPVVAVEHPADAPSEYLRYPQMLPDGRSFLFQRLAPSPDVAGIYVATLDGGKPERVLAGSDQARFAPAASGGEVGYLLYRRKGTLMAQRFEPGRRRTIGEARQVAESVGTAANTGSGAFTISTNGILAFSGDWDRTGEMIWIDRAGARLGPVNDETLEIDGLALAPGDRRLAYGAASPFCDIWVQTLPAGEPSRFTFGPEPGWSTPLWSPDGDDLAYTTYDLSGYPAYEIRRRPADRTGAETTLLRTKTAIALWDWSPDGKGILYGDEKSDLWLLPLEGAAEPIPLLVAEGIQAYAQFSPDGGFLAYASDQQGPLDVFVTTAPPSGAVWQISTGGGSMPRWRRDGRELFFRASDGSLMSVALGAGSGAAAIDGRSAARPLFAGVPADGNSPMFTYVPTQDGQRFLVAASRKSAQPPITIVTGWQRELPPQRPERGGS